MAESATGPNNSLVQFRGKAEREMPSKSQAQSRFMHATAEGKTDAPKEVGEDFIEADRGRKTSKLPKKMGKKTKHFAKRGMISQKAGEAALARMQKADKTA